MFRKQRIKREDVELDITSFMNLMIVLVPVLLMMMVFSHITVLDLKLPQLIDTTEQSQLLSDEQKQIEIMVFKQQIEIYYPQSHLLKVIPADDNGYDYDLFVSTLKQLKATLISKNIQKKDVSLLLQEETNYQTIITLMDKIRSYKAVVVASVVDAELFPDISLGDALIRKETVSLEASVQEVSQ
ncbi:MAG: biopolymer transport protein ExbD [Psychromonas sp.]|jgi:biopolymer transport protein ExbD